LGSVTPVTNQEEMGRQGFVTLLKQVFKTHMQAPDVIEKACLATWSLAVNDVNKEMMGQEGFVPLLKLVFETHMESPDVMQQACGAARNLSADNGMCLGTAE